MEYHALFCCIWKSGKIWNCRLLQIIGGVLSVKFWFFLIQQDSLQVQLSRGQESTRDTQSQPNEVCVTSNSNEKMDTKDTNSESADNGAQFTETSSEFPDCDPIDITVVNQCLREPVLCRDASETMVPSLLREVYESADPTDSMEALSVLLHVLMLETGYVSCVQVICLKHNSVLAHLCFAADNIWAVTCDFQQCGILTSVDSNEPVQPPLKLRNSKWCLVSSLIFIEYTSD